MADPADPRYLARWEVGDVTGAVVAIDVLRAFTSAAYAFGSGASAIFLVAETDHALAFKAAHPDVLAMGESGGRRVAGFDFSNSPAEVADADLTDRVLVQATGAGTRGVVAAGRAERLWAASLVCASATARAVRDAGLGVPTYVITGRWVEAPDGSGADDLLTAQLIERARVGVPLRAEETAEAVATSEEAARTLSLGPPDCDPRDVELATQVDRFAFAMEVERVADGLRLRAHARG